MGRFSLTSLLTIAGALAVSGVLHAQNPPMNCTPDGIIEVCTLVDTSAPQTAVETVAPPAPPVPHVTYVNGQLSITAENVSLSDVLREVSRKTGADLEIPNGSGGEPVFVNLGPGSIRNVLVALLNGTKFNYVMLGSQNPADSLQKIVLTPAGQATEATQSEAPSSPLPAAFSSRDTQTAQGAAPKSVEQRRAELVAQFEARKQEMVPILRQRYAEMMERAAAERASRQSSGSDSQAESSGSDSQVQPSGSNAQAQPSGSGSPVQLSGSDSQAQPSGSNAQAQPSGSDSQAPQ